MGVVVETRMPITGQGGVWVGSVGPQEPRSRDSAQGSPSLALGPLGQEHTSLDVCPAGSLFIEVCGQRHVSQMLVFHLSPVH